MKMKIILIAAAVAIVFGAGGFYGGMKYQQSKSPTLPNFQNLSNGQRMQPSGVPGGNRVQNGGMTAGEIISKDDKSITVKTPDGSTKIIFFSDSTGITKSDKGSVGDLTTGLQVNISGKSNSDGSINADSIQIRPSE